MKLCVLCRFCAFDTRERGSPDGGRGGSLWCGKGARVPDTNAPLVGQREFLEWNRFAERCRQYTPTS
jgi:hypothetical protein